MIPYQPCCSGIRMTLRTGTAASPRENPAKASPTASIACSMVISFLTSFLDRTSTTLHLRPADSYQPSALSLPDQELRARLLGCHRLERPARLVLNVGDGEGTLRQHGHGRLRPELRLQLPDLGRHVVDRLDVSTLHVLVVQGGVEVH